jgi:uncharacterized protein YegL
MANALETTDGPKNPGSGYIYVILIMVIVIIAGYILSGGSIPIDPTGPDGPPTLEPYFNASDYGQQKIIMPSGGLPTGSKENLQLETFSVNICGQKTAIAFLIDTSGSMKLDGKIAKEKEALQAFTKQLANKAVIGFYTFSRSAKEEIPLSYYKDVKKEVADTINKLKPDGETKTRNGFTLAYNQIADAIKKNKFPGYHYSLILLTDGVPELQPYDHRTCIVAFDDPTTAPAKRCFAIEQDPRTPTNIAAQLQGLGVQVYSVGIFSQTTTDKQMYPYLSALLKDVASQPLATHYYESVKGNNLKEILDTVVTNVCDPIHQ